MLSRSYFYKENYKMKINKRPKSKLSKTLTKSSKNPKKAFITSIKSSFRNNKMLSLQNLITHKNKNIKIRKNAITEKFRNKFEKIAFSLKKAILYNKKNIIKNII